jgi:uncharacterized protein YecA (UPF0149 family)
VEVRHVKENKTARTFALLKCMRKRRKGYPSEMRVKRGRRIVNGNKELIEKLGRNDLCPCNSGLRFRKCCMQSKRLDGINKGFF